ncbi:hypothetical protein MCOR27_002560 [Pyricularia oryzae]|uniref:Uncharacterized protein n=1 Tax=Pyricularia grisea TaxID=148305 RepID=A0ABQ8NYV0_PYRGI|nr:hypothetical protein MCOR01_010263 [Pyricularia oryzae]KAI6304121.1 hypothetical protein MCOR33_000869 [Pyricularia grisea]KAI6262222.1 hypothetical protein MCOR19_001575 [Pyricularia oryzae]KAI6279864.1 hypothetical protein MCOR26_003992 [Pyricularia oryzae]KAI6284798.1 hypothetical protein MCOR27_002560 [Pyricularia oryzae]
MSLNELLFQTSAQSLELDYEDAIGKAVPVVADGRCQRKGYGPRISGNAVAYGLCRVLINHQNATGNRFIGKIMIKSSEQMGRIWDAVIMLGRRPQNDEAPAREQHQPEGKKLPMIP